MSRTAAEGAQSVVALLEFFRTLPFDLSYAIARGLDTVHESMKSDLDVLIHKKDFARFARAAKRSLRVLSVTLTYGGARIFVVDSEQVVKRVDLNWRIHRRGLPLLDVGRLLSARKINSQLGVYELPDCRHAEVLLAVKRTREDREKYGALFERCGLQPSKCESAGLGKRLALQPGQCVIGLLRYLLVYLARFAFPSGLAVAGVSHEVMRRARLVDYMFMGRIRERGWISGFVATRAFSEVSVVRSKLCSDLDLSPVVPENAIDEAVSRYCTLKRSNPSLLLLRLS